MKASANAERIAKSRAPAESATGAAGGQPGEGGTIEIVFVEPPKATAAFPEGPEKDQV
jgi:hypothetical protein